MDTQRPAAEVFVDGDLVRALLQEQHPGFLDDAGSPRAGTPPRPRLVGEGWDNVTYRVGTAHAVRLPRREAAVELLRNEQRWLPVIARRVGVPVPSPVAVGGPSRLFPWPWSIVPWIRGTPADTTPLAPDQAPKLADVLRELHRPAGDTAPHNPFRGMPLAQLAEVVEGRLRRVGVRGLRAVWSSALAAREARERAWLHGDLHALNVLVRGGGLAGLIDWGDLTAGDVATDLACAWMLFDAPEDRAAFFEAYAADDAMVARAAGWAVHFACALLDSGERRHAALGADTLRRIVGG